MNKSTTVHHVRAIPDPFTTYRAARLRTAQLEAAREDRADGIAHGRLHLVGLDSKGRTVRLGSGAPSPSLRRPSGI